MNVPTRAVVKSLRALGHVECHVGFFGMKWVLHRARPTIDRFVQDHMALRGTAAAVGRNQYDIGVVFRAEEVDLYAFAEGQRCPPSRLRLAIVHEMLNVDGHGALQFVLADGGPIGTIKIYQELCHEILSPILKDVLDDMPKTICTMRTRMEQLHRLLRD